MAVTDERDLIERYVDPDTGRYAHGRADARLRGSGTPVWALVGHLRAVVGEQADHPTPAAIGQLAEDYALPREAVEAVLAYYRRHKALIDARLTLHGFTPGILARPGEDAASGGV
jgi:uncharacterized protein (DUF433 family)